MNRVADPLARSFRPVNIEGGDHIFGTWNLHAIGAVVGCHLEGFCHNAGSRVNQLDVQTWTVRSTETTGMMTPVVYFTRSTSPSPTEGVPPSVH
jgi:hypothetical protein